MAAAWRKRKHQRGEMKNEKWRKAWRQYHGVASASAIIAKMAYKNNENRRNNQKRNGEKAWRKMKIEAAAAKAYQWRAGKQRRIIRRNNGIVNGESKAASMAWRAISNNHGESENNSWRNSNGKMAAKAATVKMWRKIIMAKEMAWRIVA